MFFHCHGESACERCINYFSVALIKYYGQCKVSRWVYLGLQFRGVKVHAVREACQQAAGITEAAIMKHRGSKMEVAWGFKLSKLNPEIFINKATPPHPPNSSTNWGLCVQPSKPSGDILIHTTTKESMGELSTVSVFFFPSISYKHHDFWLKGQILKRFHHYLSNFKVYILTPNFPNIIM